MQVHTDINALPIFKNAVITIGTFDGVHEGHYQVINQLKKEAQQISGESVIITFHPHPRMVLPAGKTHAAPLKLLTTLDEKIELLSGHGIDHLVVVPFTPEFSNMEAEVYISDFLVKKFHPKIIITGFDHRFGKNRTGDYHLLEKFQSVWNYTVKEIPEFILDHITISSTKIREALRNGNISVANESLGYPYFFSGTVIHGNHLGTSLGYPTANIELENEYKLIPKFGVYAVTAELEIPNNTPPFKSEIKLKGMMNIGIRPTIGDDKMMIEVNLFDFDQMIYGRRLRVHLFEYLREEAKLDSMQELISAMEKDKANTLAVLSKNIF